MGSLLHLARYGKTSAGHLKAKVAQAGRSSGAWGQRGRRGTWGEWPRAPSPCRHFFTLSKVGETGRDAGQKGKPFVCPPPNGHGVGAFDFMPGVHRFSVM